MTKQGNRCSKVMEAPGITPIDISSLRNFSSLMLQNLTIPRSPIFSKANEEPVIRNLEKINYFLFYIFKKVIF